MFLGQRVRSLVRIRGDAFRACDVDEGVVARLVRLLSHGADRLQLLFRIHEAFVSPGNVVVHLNPEDVALLGVADNLLRVVGLQSVRPDANVVGPILAGGEFLGELAQQQDEKLRKSGQAKAGSYTRWS